MAYQQPASYGGHPTQPGPPRTAALGWVALFAGVVCLVGSAVNGIAVGTLTRPEMFEQTQVQGQLALGGAAVLLSLLLVWFAFSLWAIIQGVVACAQRRGTGPGVGAIVLGLVGPWVGPIIAFAMIGVSFAEYYTG